MFAICDATGLFHGATAAEVIDALMANDKLSTTAPVDVTISGLSGQQIDVQINPDWSGGCPIGPDDPPTRDYKTPATASSCSTPPMSAPSGSP